MLNLSPVELLVILTVALVVLGPSRLPEAARQLGKAMQELRRMSAGFEKEIRSALDEPTSPRAPAPQTPQGAPPVVGSPDDAHHGPGTEDAAQGDDPAESPDL